MRHTDDPKEYIIKARINETMYNHVRNRANKQGAKVSEIIRELITRDMNRQ